MAKQYAIQTRNKEHYSQWDSCYDHFDNLPDARKEWIKQLVGRDTHWGKKTMRLVSYTVLDKSVPEYERPAKGCAIAEVLEFHEDK